MKHCRQIGTRRALALLVGSLILLPACAGRERTLLDARVLGDEALREGRYEEAAAQYERYLETRPGRPEVLHDLGLAYEGMGEASAAREAFSVAFELQPDNPVYIESLARAMAANGETDAAFRLLERIAVESLRADAYTRLGSMLLNQGLPDEGVLALRIAAQLQPAAEPYRALAAAYRGFGDTERELGELRHVLWFAPDDEATRSRVRELGSIPGPTFATPPAP